ncbi:biotin--[acetyl-CoA-carboxylase] ligase [Vineibacter terrae]|uniref:biotin--[acetyl-CoA-carboxylase] ligase n=1 Tax=Vineibacter terrae TaxID=2586908 RepID=UPI002E2EAB4C|nr:biotin--[acetyl-CoA-carboxylase] ligase [Vineibacter terrae]HEX2892214.1 biotin--[acetyl-CoA-carboxylase] ligase [Vineibacter terrae]
MQLPPEWTAIVFETIGSTNDEALRRAEAGAPEGTVIVSRQQEGGRGRRGRTWTSPPGNAYSSTIIRPRCVPERAAQLGFVTALAVCDAAAAGLPGERAIRLKWPNDVLVDGAKISGILLESAMAADGSVEHVVIGTGINVAVPPPAGVATYAAACLHDLGDRRDAPEVLHAYLAALAVRLAQWRQGFDGTRADWLARAAWLGERVAVSQGEIRIEGRFAGLDADGALLLEPSDGPPRRIVSGEVFRPVG